MKSVLNCFILGWGICEVPLWHMHSRNTNRQNQCWERSLCVVQAIQTCIFGFYISQTETLCVSCMTELRYKISISQTPCLLFEISAPTCLYMKNTDSHFFSRKRSSWLVGSRGSWVKAGKQGCNSASFFWLGRSRGQQQWSIPTNGSHLVQSISDIIPELSIDKMSHPSRQRMWTDRGKHMKLLWSLRLTFWPRNCIQTASHRNGLNIKDVLTLMPPIYTEYPSASAKHGGLACGAILRKLNVILVSKGSSLFPRKTHQEIWTVIFLVFPLLTGSQESIRHRISNITKNAGDFMVQLMSLGEAINWKSLDHNHIRLIFDPSVLSPCGGLCCKLE